MKIKIKDNDGKVIDEVELTMSSVNGMSNKKEKKTKQEYRYWVTTSLDGTKYEGGSTLISTNTIRSIYHS